MGRLFEWLSVWEGSGCVIGWREVMTRKSTVKRVAFSGQARCFFSFGIARVACYEGMGNWARDRDVFVLLCVLGNGMGNNGGVKYVWGCSAGGYE